MTREFISRDVSDLDDLAALLLADHPEERIFAFHGQHPAANANQWQQIFSQNGHFCHCASYGKIIRFAMSPLLAQGFSAFLDDADLLPHAKKILELKSSAEGYIQTIDAKEVGNACVQLGAGRATLKDEIDPAVGIRFLKKAGDAVSHGEVMGLVLANDDDRGQAAVRRVLEALVISKSPPAPRPLIIKRVGQRRNEVSSGQ